MTIPLDSSMDITFWITVTVAFLFGAMSPGPSLAVIINHSLSQGRIAGVCAALSHGVAIGLFAYATASGLSLAIAANPFLFDAIQILGSAFLVFLAIRLLMAPLKKDVGMVVSGPSSVWQALRDGFLIAVVNPKVLLFFTALFSQVVTIDIAPWEKVALALLAGGVDALWFMLIAVALSHSRLLIRFQKSSWVLDKMFSLILFAIASHFILEVFARSGLL
jgi:threonine/homoserine/homoserine lactone efflux protein